MFKITTKPWTGIQGNIGHEKFKENNKFYTKKKYLTASACTRECRGQALKTWAECGKHKWQKEGRLSSGSLMATPGKNRLQCWCTIMQAFSSFFGCKWDIFGTTVRGTRGWKWLMDEHQSSWAWDCVEGCIVSWMVGPGAVNTNNIFFSVKTCTISLIGSSKSYLYMSPALYLWPIQGAVLPLARWLWG